MALGPRLELRQGQSLVMTPQLQQAIKLLQLSNLELNDYVEQELERNPLLEASNEEGQPDRGENGQGDSDTYLDNASTSEAGGDIEPAPLTVNDDTAPPAPEGDLDTDYDNVYADESKADRVNEAAAAEAGPQSSSSDWQSTKSSGSGSFDGEGSFESTLTKEIDLNEHLTEQLNVAISSERERFMGAYLIDQLTEAGYLTETL
jgi:RNA polymerase sigma-54 factor